MELAPLLLLLFAFTLSIFLGFELISKLPSQLHTPLMSGANDAANPAAHNDPGSPLYGMSIINAHEAKTVYCLKRGKGTEFSGLENALFFGENTRMLYGDAKATVTAGVSHFGK